MNEQFIEKTEYYYPEVEVTDISYEASENGDLIPRITIGPAEEDADEDDEDDDTEDE